MTGTANLIPMIDGVGFFYILVGIPTAICSGDWLETETNLSGDAVLAGAILLAFVWPLWVIPKGLWIAARATWRFSRGTVEIARAVGRGIYELVLAPISALRRRRRSRLPRAQVRR